MLQDLQAITTTEGGLIAVMLAAIVYLYRQKEKQQREHLSDVKEMLQFVTKVAESSSDAMSNSTDAIKETLSELRNRSN